MHRSSIIDRCLALLSHVVCDTNLAEYVTDEDLVYITNRAKREGLEFLTVTLPKLGKHLEACLRVSAWTPITGFGSSKNSNLPRLFRTSFLHIFEGDRPKCMPYGVYDSSIMAAAVQAIRQVTLMFYKLEQEPTAQQLEDAMATFFKTERDIQHWKALGGVQQIRSDVRKLARKLVCWVVGSANPRDISPRHGSGVSACRTDPWDRFDKPRFSVRLNSEYPYSEYFVTQPNGWDEPWMQDAPEHVELVARMAFVPKDSRGPRIICAEPREHMFIQQGQMDLLYESIERHQVARFQVTCRDQSRNRALARYGSITGSYATLDLKEASDRVTPELVQELFPRDWVFALNASRSEVVILPDGHPYVMSKFAPMGSAVCFPVEAICFWALSLAAVMIERGLTFDDLIADHSISPGYEVWAKNCSVSVFGDDIIVPSDLSERVINTLESAGLLVNRLKSYCEGPFRESCGGDFCLGYDVGIERIKHLPLPAPEPSRARKDTMNYYSAAMRTRDFLNRIALRHHTWLGNKSIACFMSMYDLPCFPLDYFNVVEGETFRGGANLGIICDRSYQPPPLKKRPHARKGYWTLKEGSVDLTVDTSGWCWVMRALVVGSRDIKITGQPDRAHAGIVTFPKRHRYTFGWARANVSA